MLRSSTTTTKRLLLTTTRRRQVVHLQPQPQLQPQLQPQPQAPSSLRGITTGIAGRILTRRTTSSTPPASSSSSLSSIDANVDDGRQQQRPQNQYHHHHNYHPHHHNYHNREELSDPLFRPYGQSTKRTTTTSTRSRLTTASCVPLSQHRNRLHHHYRSQPLQPQQPQLLTQQRQIRWKSVFVSRHNHSLHVTRPILEDLLISRLGLHPATADVRVTSTHMILRECPFCAKPTNNKADNLYKLYVRFGSGAYFCHRCGAGGSWFDFKAKLNGGGTGAAGSGRGGAASPKYQYASAASLGSHGGASTDPSRTARTGGGGGGWTGYGYAGGGGGGGGGGRLDTRNIGYDPYDNHNHNADHPSQRRAGTYGYGTGSGGGGGAASGPGSAVPCLPMPPRRLQALYTTDLFTPDPAYVEEGTEKGQDQYQDDHNHDETSDPPDEQNDENDGSVSSTSDKKKKGAFTRTNRVLDYLVHVRGLEPRTLRKYGVGRARYAFPNNDGQQQQPKWEKTECVTFSWIMSVSDAEYQEELRGAKFEYYPTPPPAEQHQQQAATADSSKDQSNPSDESEKRYNPKDDMFVTRRIKARSIDNKAWQRLDPPGGAWGFFGYHTVPRTTRASSRAGGGRQDENTHDDGGNSNNSDIPKPIKEIVITEGEYDAMSVWQATHRPCISLPNGCRSLPVECLPMLEEFDRVYLWMDNDTPGQEGADSFARKIGLERTYIVKPTQSNCVKLHRSNGDDGLDTDDAWDFNKEPVRLPKDANEALVQGLDLNRIIDDAKLTPHERILSFDDLREDVLHEILHPDQYSGIPITSLPKFTSIVKGMRRGELTVLTGPTGSGKTTFLGQMSLDLAEQGVNVLWGSFEIKNTRLMHKLLQQFAREPLVGDGNLDQSALTMRLQSIADKFSHLPMHFLKFHGGSDIDDVLDAMEYAVYVNDVQHIILDNMQFMISRQSASGNRSPSSFDKFDVQDMAIEKFRKFATEKNVHVVLVVHPRKEQEASHLNISSVYGSAKATQEADTVLIIQHQGDRKYIDVKKNRFNGDLGFASLFYDRRSGRYFEEPLINGRAKILPKLHVPKGQERANPTNDHDEGLIDPDTVRKIISKPMNGTPRPKVQY